MISDPKLRCRIWLGNDSDGLVVILGGGMCEELDRDWARMMNLTRTELGAREQNSGKVGNWICPGGISSKFHRPTLATSC